MNLLQQLESRVREEFPGIQARLDLAEVPEASSWLDLTLRGLRATVEWRPGRGFGVSPSSETVYGEGSDELYPDVSTAINRLFAILERGSRNKPHRPTILTRRQRRNFNPRRDLTEDEFVAKYRTITPRKQVGKTRGAYGGKEGVVR